MYVWVLVWASAQFGLCECESQDALGTFALRVKVLGHFRHCDSRCSGHIALSFNVAGTLKAIHVEKRFACF